MYGVVTATSGTGFTITVEGANAAAISGAGTYNNWNLTNRNSTSGISFNTTYESDTCLA